MQGSQSSARSIDSSRPRAPPGRQQQWAEPLPRRRAPRLAATAAADAANNAPPPSPSRKSNKKHVAVVGGGVGGLCVAGILAKAGHRVTIYEQGDRVGGRCQGEWLETGGEGGGGGDGGGGRKRFRFDTGPSLLLLPDAYRAAFARMGQPSLEAAGLKLRRVGPDAAYRVFFTDGDDSKGGGGNAGDNGGRPKTAATTPAAAAPTRHLDLLYDEDAMVAQLEARAQHGRGAANGPAPPIPSHPHPHPHPYRAWLADARRMLDSGWGAFIARDFGCAADGPLLSLLRVLDPRVLLPLLLSGRLPSNPLEMLEPHARALARRFPGDPDLQALLSFQDLYVGLSPSSAPGVFSLLAATELQDGVHYPEGGFGAVRDALLRAAMAAGGGGEQEGGVEVRTRARVRRVLVAAGDDAGARVEGVEVVAAAASDGEAVFERADAVVCNADVPSAYALLADGGGGGGGDGGGNPPPPSFSAARYGAETSSRLLSTQKKYSAGVIAYYWCVEGGALTQLPQHTVFVRSPSAAGTAERAWRRARSAAELEASPNFYVHCPARTDPTALSHPAESDSVMVLLPVANLQEVAAAAGAGGTTTGAFDDGLIAAGRDAILRALAAALPGTLRDAGGAADLRECIAREEVRAPPEWQRRHALGHGAAFGLAHGLDQLAALRPALKDGAVKGLYCVGASARPGNGVPLVLTGATLCADAVLADFAREEDGGGVGAA